MFEAGFEDIDAVYIDKPDIGALALAGMQQLSTIDSDVTARRTGNKVELLLKNQIAYSRTVDSDFDPEAWGDLTADVLDEATAESEKIKTAPIEKVHEAMFSGVVSKLDQFSRYSSAENAREARAARDGFGGIGVRISVEDDQVRVVSVQHYTPAERMGLKTDDIITAINGESTKGLGQREVVERLRGAVDSKVDITVKRATRDPFDVTITRAHVVPESINYRREGDVGYFRIYSFNAETAASLKRAVADAEQEIGPRMRGLVIDLRDNPGGLLNQSVAVSNLFLREGRVVSTHGRHPDSHQYFEASGDDIAKGKPIVVMVDGNSASAAEIVAAALQDNRRAVVVGSNTYGKGTVQTVLPLPNQGEITLTWARFHAPSGYTLHHLGVLPSVCTSVYRSAEEVMRDLGRGQLPQVPTGRRNAVKPDDTKGLDSLRKACPAREQDNPVDLEVALRLVSTPDMFASAVRLAEPPQLGLNHDDENTALAQ
ncbi:S41 family peptidase [Dongia deserti]|uniref:S41 family peptidase n=1 Tax=Dongia deserti TaxID=2268030 RepID=UPI0013C4C1C8|nr:S41 family peptidase [Dongia deserti]